MNEISVIDKKLIIIIYPYRFRKFDRIRFEIECLKKHATVVIYELIDSLYPAFTKAYHTRDNSTDIIRYNSIKHWREDYKKMISTYKSKPFVLNFIPRTTFKGVYINYILSYSDCYLVKYNIPGIPEGIHSTSLIENIKIKIWFILNRGTVRFIKYFFIAKITTIISYIFCREPDYILTAGSEHIVDRGYKGKEIFINSFDYTMFLCMEKENLNKNDVALFKNKIIYVDTGAPFFHTDNHLTGNRHPLTVNKWYPALRDFFNNIEKAFNSEVVIMAHPKHLYDSESAAIFGGRKVIHEKTKEAISLANMVLITNSSAVSYAVLFEKPVVILCSDEIINENSVFYNDSKFWSLELNCPLININSYPSFSIIDNFGLIDKKSYAQYINKYLTSRKDAKTNCEIIIDEVINNESSI